MIFGKIVKMLIVGWLCTDECPPPPRQQQKALSPAAAEILPRSARKASVPAGQKCSREQNSGIYAPGRD